MELVFSLPWSQEPAPMLYQEEVLSCPHLRIISQISMLDLHNAALPSSLSTKILCAFPISPIRTTCSAHLIRLDLIVRINISWSTNYEALNSSSSSRASVQLCKWLSPSPRLSGVAQ
jgi:hypothetical protein